MTTGKAEGQKGSQDRDGFRAPSLHPGSESSADEQSTRISDKPTKNDTGEGREPSGESEEHALASKLMSIRKYMDDELLTAAKIASVTQPNGNNDDATCTSPGKAVGMFPSPLVLVGKMATSPTSPKTSTGIKRSCSSSKSVWVEDDRAI